ncbi:MAG: HigA family addiction module antitoxin [Spirochaetota bacterium]
MTSKRKPVHPGTILKEDVLKPLGLTVTEASAALGVSRKTLSELIHEKASLSPDMAIRIAKATNTSPESWLNMQTNVDLWRSEQKDLQVVPFPTHTEPSHGIGER